MKKFHFRPAGIFADAGKVDEFSDPELTGPAIAGADGACG